MADGEYSRSAQQCRVKINNLKQKYRKIRDGDKISRNQRQEWEMFELMDRVLQTNGGRWLDGYPAYFIWIFADVNRTIIE